MQCSHLVGGVPGSQHGVGCRGQVVLHLRPQLLTLGLGLCNVIPCQNWSGHPVTPLSTYCGTPECSCPSFSPSSLSSPELRSVSQYRRVAAVSGLIRGRERGLSSPECLPCCCEGCGRCGQYPGPHPDRDLVNIHSSRLLVKLLVHTLFSKSSSNFA